MRRRSAALLVSGVLAVCGILLPSIQKQSSHGDTRILKVVVNGGHPIVLGASGSAEFSFSITAEDNSGIKSVDGVGIWGSNYGILVPSATTCHATSKTVSVCTGTSSVSVPKRQIFDNMAGHWTIRATAKANDGDERTEDRAGQFQILKQARVTAFGGPTETLPAGQDFVINGYLEKPDWDNQTMVPNTWQAVELLFCADGCTRPVWVTTVRSDSGGNLEATVKAEKTGTYTWVYRGAYWSAPATSFPTQVAVKS